MLTKLWSLSSYKAADLATDRDAVPGPEIVPEYFWSNCVQLTSAVKVLDRGPDDVGTDDSQVEVRVAGADEAKQRHRVGTDRRLASITVM